MLGEYFHAFFSLLWILKFLYMFLLIVFYLDARMQFSLLPLEIVSFQCAQ